MTKIPTLAWTERVIVRDARPILVNIPEIALFRIYSSPLYDLTGILCKSASYYWNLFVDQVGILDWVAA